MQLDKQFITQLLDTVDRHFCQFILVGAKKSTASSLVSGSGHMLPDKDKQALTSRLYKLVLLKLNQQLIPHRQANLAYPGIRENRAELLHIAQNFSTDWEKIFQLLKTDGQIANSAIEVVMKLKAGGATSRPTLSQAARMLGTERMVFLVPFVIFESYMKAQSEYFPQFHKYTWQYMASTANSNWLLGVFKKVSSNHFYQNAFVPSLQLVSFVDMYQKSFELARKGLADTLHSENKAREYSYVSGLTPDRNILVNLVIKERLLPSDFYVGEPLKKEAFFIKEHHSGVWINLASLINKMRIIKDKELLTQVHFLLRSQPALDDDFTVTQASMTHQDMVAVEPLLVPPRTKSLYAKLAELVTDTPD